LGHYEGRGWRGFHHHASLSIAAYGFLLAQRLQHPDEIGGKKNSAQRQELALPRITDLGKSPGAAPRPILHHELADPHRRASGSKAPTLPLLLPSLERQNKCGVEMWRGGRRQGNRCCRPFRLAVPYEPNHSSVIAVECSLPGTPAQIRTCPIRAFGSYLG